MSDYMLEPKSWNKSISAGSLIIILLATLVAGIGFVRLEENKQDAERYRALCVDQSVILAHSLSQHPVWNYLMEERTLYTRDDVPSEYYKKYVVCLATVLFENPVRPGNYDEDVLKRMMSAFVLMREKYPEYAKPEE